MHRKSSGSKFCVGISDRLRAMEKKAKPSCSLIAPYWLYSRSSSRKQNNSLKRHIFSQLASDPCFIEHLRKNGCFVTSIQSFENLGYKCSKSEFRRCVVFFHLRRE